MPLSTTQQAALNAFLETLGVGTASTPIAWWRDTSSPVPTAPLADVNDEAEIKRYAAHGYRTNLTRGVATQDWDKFLTLCDQVSAAATPEAANSIMPGAGYFAPDVACLLMLGGGVAGMGPFQQPHIFAPYGSGFNLVQAAAWLVATPGSAGPGY